jgi:EAL and modified HD-GYP domain-containing signal transduction protein
LSHYEDSNQAFLMGLFSLIDALVDQPIAEALQSIQLEGKVANILLGHGAKQDLLTSLFELISAYEPGNWDEVERLSSKCGILPAEVGQAYLDATSWVEQFSQIAIA